MIGCIMIISAHAALSVHLLFEILMEFRIESILGDIFTSI